MSSSLMMQLEVDEGFRSFPYKDSMGKLTIGYGFNLTDVGLSQKEGEAILASRLEDLSDWLKGALPWTKELDEPRRDALLNMAYNVGKRGLLSFYHMLRAMEDKRWQDAANEMAKSEWAEQVGGRAKRLRVQVLTGVVQSITAPSGTPGSKWREL